ncbi:MAG TPA: class I SAM-dependent methyltransferase [Acidimicrobiia bacterium]|nr:class I SAM-dependent methyltransferase [Acidimicrobiia bacterium]
MSEADRVKVVPSTAQVGAGEVQNVPGNNFDKHGSTNPIVTRLMDRFHSGLIEAVARFQPESILDVGCGEGRTTKLIEQAFTVPTVGTDLEEVVLQEANTSVSAASFYAGSIYQLAHRDHGFDVVIGTEVLEHVDDPGGAVDELIRVAHRGVVVTVPHEPWWRMANMARGMYWSDLGNTPGHIQHWSPGSFRAFLDERADRVTVSTVGLWLLGSIEV